MQQIAGDKVKLIPLAVPGQNLHTFEPSPKRLSELARADVWLLSGAEFELSLKPKIKNSFKNLAIVDTTESVVFRSLAPNEIDDDEEDSIDRHSWLGREPAKIAIRHIKNVLYMGNMGDRHEHRGAFHGENPGLHGPINLSFRQYSARLKP
ncbi:MAG: metal ABC transporter substrate-binding protein [Treponema sp.]|nr:metal ABC transporter substrate-binding protein [Treponema sp.]